MTNNVSGGHSASGCSTRDWDHDKSVIESHLEMIAKLNRDISALHYWIHERLKARPDLQEWYESLLFKKEA